VNTDRPQFASIVLDVDSTLTRVEGIEWLAARRGPDVGRAIEEMTRRAMEGEVALQDVYATRLQLVRPGREDIAALTQAYIEGTMPGAAVTLAYLRDAGAHLCVVSGGLREAVVPFTETLGFTPHDVHAVPLSFTADGQYRGYDATSPLSHRNGKPTVVRALGLARRVLAVGDGSTDAELGPAAAGRDAAVDAFAAFVGVAERPAVVAVADYVVRRFSELEAIVCGSAVT
jgi:phosphoserine phosphatase